MDARFSIRTATPGDDAAVVDVLRAAYPTGMAAVYDPDLLRPALPLMTRSNPALLASGSYYLAEAGPASGRQAVGCGGWTCERPGSGDVVPGLAHVRQFASHPDWGGKGVGRAIWDRTAATARAAGIRAFEVYSSLNAEGFYAAVGFSVRLRTTVTMSPGLEFPVVLMERRL